MLGVGVNSDAGLTGNVVLDEKSFGKDGDLQRYRQRLAEQQTMGRPYSGTSISGNAGVALGSHSLVEPQYDAYGVTLGQRQGGFQFQGATATANPSPSSTTPAPPPQAQPQQATGLASLDFDLPEQGRLYNLVATRGETEVTARAIPSDTLDRLVRLALALGAAAVVILLVRLLRRARMPWPASARITLLSLGLGALSLVTGVFPVLGAALIGIGLAMAIRRATEGRA